MKITSTGIVNGVIKDKYGAKGSQKNKSGIPNYSLPFKIEDAPKETVTYALFLEDRDAIPVCGFAWIHWVACNIKQTEILENESLTANYVQGTTSWHGRVFSLGNLEQMEATGYGGMTPPDAPHVYDLHVYALDTELPLKKGFYANELFKAMEGHILAEAKISGTYSN